MILATIVNNLASLDQHLVGVANLKHPLGNGSIGTNSPGTYSVKNDWSYIKTNGCPSKGVTGTVYEGVVNSPSTLAARHWVDIVPQISANSKEFWFREGLLSLVNPSTYSNNSTIPSVLFEVRNSLQQVIASLSASYSSGNVTYNWNTVVPATGVISATRAVGVINQINNPDDAYGNTAYDVRMLLDDTAGFVQLYDNAGTLLGEMLGATIYAGSSPAYITLNYPAGTNCNDFRAPVRYAILATTTTFGMYALPLPPKAAGIHNDMLSGSYTSFLEHLTVTLPATPVKLEAGVGQTKRANFKYTSLSDIVLPANFKLDAIVVSALVTAVNSDGAVLSPVLELSVDGATMYEVAANTITPNLSIDSGKYQVISKVVNNNPANSSAWNVADMSNFYAGIKLVR